MAAASLLGQRRWGGAHFYRLGFETEERETMKKRFNELSESEQEAVELAYQQMKPEEFDEQMAQAKQKAPAVLRLPPELVKTLEAVAESEGEPEYQVMVRRWIEERLQQKQAAA
jgi:hypothetical protein